MDTAEFRPPADTEHFCPFQLRHKGTGQRCVVSKEGSSERFGRDKLVDVQICTPPYFPYRKVISFPVFASQYGCVA
ncbi:hypothetical protein NDU88_003294 [Pleurodeles waltl]|uniref:Uncharacterized protein n=1 Tax=Pleurodeles waltl TaxID=8319 RepID=A0AAV7LGN7_PLEWA|nr:hypothetical protein NDU88_003294 [Pleurodeles waltl]